MSVKSLNMDIFTDLEVETARVEGNTAFRVFAEAWEVWDKYVGDRPDEYRQRLQARARGKTLFSDRVSDSISSLFTWLDCTVLKKVNDTLGNSQGLGKVGNVIEEAYSAYEVRVEKVMDNENGCWSKLKRQVDGVAVVFQTNPTDYCPLLEKPERDIQLVTQ